MAIYLCSESGVISYTTRTWAIGDRMVPQTSDATTNADVAKCWVWECTTGGASSATPAWAGTVTQDVTTVVQGVVVWKARKPGFSSGTTVNWNFATLFIQYAALAAAAGETIYVAQDHSEVRGNTSANYFAGTPSAPNTIVCADRTQSPLGYSAAATCGTSGSANMTFRGSFTMQGITYNAATGTGSNNITLGNATGDEQIFESCTFNMNSTGATSRVTFGIGTASTSPPSKVTLNNCFVKFSNSAQKVLAPHTFLHWNGGGLIAGSQVATFLSLGSSGRGGVVVCDGLNLTGLSTSSALCDASVLGSIMFRNCTLPTGWTGTLHEGPVPVGSRVAMYNCDVNGSDTNYRFRLEEYAGSTRDEIVYVKSGGATDGVTPISWKLDTNAGASYPTMPMKSLEIMKWHDVTSGQVSVDLDFLTDSATALTTQDIWLTVQYLGNPDSNRSLFTTSKKEILATTAEDHGTSAATWVTTDMVNPRKQKLTTTFTPRESGFFIATVFLAKPSTTVYLDPVLQVQVL